MRQWKGRNLRLGNRGNEECQEWRRYSVMEIVESRVCLIKYGGGVALLGGREEWIW